MFLEKYGSLVLYDEDVKKIFIIENEVLQFDKISGCNLIGIPNEINGLMSDNEYFCIHDIIFDKIQSTHQYNNISLNIISNEPNEHDSKCDAIEIFDYKKCNKNSEFGMNKLRHNIQRNREKL